VPGWHSPAGHPPSSDTAARHCGVAASPGLLIPMVNISPPVQWHIPLHLCHRALGSPSRPHIRRDLMMPQGFAELTSSPKGRAVGAEKWHKVAQFRAFFKHPYTCLLAPHSALGTQHSFGLPSTIVPASVWSLSGGKVDYPYSAPFSPGFFGLSKRPLTDFPASQGLAMKKYSWAAQWFRGRCGQGRRPTGERRCPWPPQPTWPSSLPSRGAGASRRRA
jgi:hypothetical protein